MNYKNVKAVAAKVFEAKGEWIKIAYPEEHFEEGNMSQILASIAGNVFGMKAVGSVKAGRHTVYQKDCKIISRNTPVWKKKGIRNIFKVYDSS